MRWITGITTSTLCKCCEHLKVLNSPQIPPLIDALHYNTWFTFLSLSDIKLPPEAGSSLTALARRTRALIHIELNNVNLSRDFYCNFAEAASQNPESILSEIVFRNCPTIDDKGTNIDLDITSTLG
jgi:uncharacterized ferritin-like protein (DUF455 family)